MSTHNVPSAKLRTSDVKMSIKYFGDLPSIIQCKFDIEFPKIGDKNILPNNIYLTIFLLNYTNNRQKHTTFFPDADNVGETGVSWSAGRVGPCWLFSHNLIKLYRQHYMRQNL